MLKICLKLSWTFVNQFIKTTINTCLFFHSFFLILTNVVIPTQYFTELNELEMDFHVLLQGICCIKHLVASKTTIFRLKMITHVVTQLAFSFEVSIIRAHLAFKLFLITVSCLMVCQIRFSRKSFIASGTHVGFFSRVSSHVNCKVLLAFKTL